VSKTKLIRFIICVVIFLLGFISQADASDVQLTYSTNGFSQQFGNDMFTVQGASGTTFVPVGPTSFHIINSASFTQGQCPNNICQPSAFDAGFTLTLGDALGDSVTHFLSQPATYTHDSIAAGNGSTVLFVLRNDNFAVDVMLDPYNLPTLPTGGSFSTQVQATFTPVPIPAATPEPASILFFGTGLLGMALMLRKSLLA
jgi:hypothetical protein